MESRKSHAHSGGHMLHCGWNLNGRAIQVHCRRRLKRCLHLYVRWLFVALLAGRGYVRPRFLYITIALFEISIPYLV